jgi:long-chain fatty acid transport protein
MSRRGWGDFLRAGTALGLLAIATAQANAGALAVHEQSAYGQGMSFAGVAAGGSLQTMFWNPAVMTQFDGVQSASSYTAFFPSVKNSAIAGTFVPPLGGTNNVYDQALIPAGYFSYQLNPNLWLGMSLNSPFGLTASFPEIWAGRDYSAGNQSLRTYNAAPSIAYRFNDWISVGVGVQIQYANAAFNHGVTAFLDPRTCSFLTGSPGINGFCPVGDAKLSGDGWSYGFTAGVTLTPTPTTTVGIGYRSGLNQKISGTVTLPSGVIPAETTVDFPGTLSVGLRQRLDPQWTLLGTVEWTNWSRIGTSNVTSGGALVTTLPFQNRDGWFFSIGGEYQASDRLTLRAGFAYEISPIDDQVRIPLIPDTTRYWASVGASWVIFKGLKADIGYSHVFEPNASINISAASGNPWFANSVSTTNPFGVTYIGSAQSHADIFSLGLNWRWDDVFR